MQLVAPVTDYIPASLLTTNGDTVIRGATLPERLARAGSTSYLQSHNVAGQPEWRGVAGIAGKYLRAMGAGSFPDLQYMALRDTGIFIGEGTHSTAEVDVHTGVGFQPSVVLFFAVDADFASLNRSVGFDDGTVHMCIFVYNDNTGNNIKNTHSIYIDKVGDNHFEGVISAFSGDGFSITWTKTGNAGAKYTYLCLP